MTQRVTQWTRWEAAPVAPFPDAPGPVVGADGEPLHGVWGRVAEEGVQVVIAANHGHLLDVWSVPDHRWGEEPPLLSVLNAVVSQPWLWWHPRRKRLVTSEPPDTALGLVLAGRKPACEVATTDRRRAERWMSAASDAGFHVARRAIEIECPPGSPAMQIVSVARRETFGELFDLAALAEDLVVCGVADAHQLGLELALLHPTPVYEALQPIDGDPDIEDESWLFPSTPAGVLRKGLSLGYHPALITGELMGHAAHLSAEARERTRSEYWMAVHRARTAVLPDLPGFGAAIDGAKAAERWGGAA